MTERAPAGPGHAPLQMTAASTSPRYRQGPCFPSPTRFDIRADTFGTAGLRVKVPPMSHSMEIPMKKLILATAAAIVLGAPRALAANTGSNLLPAKPTKTHVAASSLSERCIALGTQFDKAEATHKTDKNYKEALALRGEGKSLCVAHKEAEGIKKIESALGMIGITPKVKG
jgi:hypothetical protein